MHKAYFAYENKKFLNSSEGRTLRVIAEYLEPKHRFERNDIKNTVVFFGSARILSEEESKNIKEKSKFHELSKFYEKARELAKKVTEWGMVEKKQKIYVCSGGGPGIMEAANRGSYEAGGKSIGLNISLPFEQEPNDYISSELNFEYHYFFMRKLMFAFYAKALLIFPGGYGTMDEFMEFLTLIQTKKIKKLPIVVMGKKFWNDFINFDALVEYGTISKEDRDLFIMTDDVDEAFEYIKQRAVIED